MDSKHRLTETDTHGVLDRLCRDMGVLGGGRKFGVAQKHLNDADCYFALRAAPVAP
jgi:hypothetical protein